MGPTIYKVEAMGDVLYIEASSRDAAEVILFRFTGPIPESMLKWSEVSRREVPKDEKVLS
jgi:hypothetical protein